MPVLKKNSMMPNYIFLKKINLLMIFLCLSSITMAKTVDIKSTHAYLENDTYYIDTVFDFKLTSEAHEALMHGIPLEIHTHFQLRQERKWFWDKTVSEKIIKFKLEHMPLTNNFITININTGLRNSYSDLDTALKYINTISRIKLFEQGLLHEGNNYFARIKMFLDIASLPPPLRPQAYFSSKWDMSSEWFEWEVLQ